MTEDAEAGVPRNWWHRRQWFETQGAIARAAADLDGQGERITQAALARRSGVDRATVRRHFERPEDALTLVIPQSHIDHLMQCLETRPETEPSSCMAVQALLDCVRTETPNVVYTRNRAEFLSSCLEAQLLVLADYIERVHPVVSQRLAERHGRGAPSLEDFMATDMLGLVYLRSMVAWWAEGYRRDYEEVVVELIALLGHAPLA